MAMTRVVYNTQEWPAEVREWIRPGDELMVFVQGDTLILKKVHPPRLSELAARAPDDAEMPLQEIVDEVHRYRREKRHARGS